MARPASWYRLFRGKVWHLGFADDTLAACGSERPTDAETVGERAPVNARVCGDCVATALHLYALAQAAQMGDPRTPERGLIGVPGVPLPEVDDGVIDAEIVECCDCDNPEHKSICCDCQPAEGEPEEWLCKCGHSNLDHDVDDMQWCRATGECLCPGLTRVG